MKLPEVGDRIIHDEPEFERVTEGIIVDILSSQFVYKTEGGYFRYCFTKKDLWKKVE
jgi:hypothetical protein